MYHTKLIIRLLFVLLILITNTIETTYLDEYCVVTAHNAFTYKIIFPNQQYDIPKQLEDGVRGFMLDNYDKSGKIKLCHNSLGCHSNTFVKVMNDYIISYLKNNSDSIITIIIEDHVDNTSLWESSLKQIIDIDKYAFNPFNSNWNRTSNHWPTIDDMINNNQRLLIFTSLPSNAGNFSVNNGTDNLYIMNQWEWTVENYWSLGDTIGEHNYSCYNREESESLNSVSVSQSGFNWTPLFVMNQFHGTPDPEGTHSRVDNEYTHLLDRFMNYCYPASNKLPNYLSVDNYNEGDPLEFVDIINKGGFIFYEGNNATQDVVCGVVGSFTHNVNMMDNNIGCENDEARSVLISNVNARTKLTVYDNPDSSTSDDFCEIYIKKDIGKYYEENEYIINSFEANINDEFVLVNCFRNNGLDGKVSNIDILLDYVFYDDAKIILYEGNDGTQNIVCSLEIQETFNVDFTSHSECDNDEVRSLIFNKALAGTKIIIYDSPTQSTNDDFYVIDVIENIELPYIISSFERNINYNFIQGRYHSVNGLNGKVSNIQIFAPGDNSFFYDAQVILYEGNSATQDIVCILSLSNDLEVDFKNKKNNPYGCDNDETRSLKITKAKKGTKITVYDSPSGKLDDDYYKINILKDITVPMIVSSYEKSMNNGFIKGTYYDDNGLDGKVSRIKIETP